MKLKIFFALVLIFIFFIPQPANAGDTGFLWLVNRENPLCENFQPADLVTFHGVRLRAPARDAFSEMLAAMEAEGIRGLHLQSAYRSYSYQREIFEKKIRKLVANGNTRSVAAAIAAQSIQPPGASEHQLGLALDVSINGRLSQEFAETDAGHWLAENCHKFGFIIRYPQEKTDVTDIIFEPWHLRYVGIPHAQIMRENAKTLEEYGDFLEKIHAYVVWGDDEYFLTMYTNEPPPEAEFSAIAADKNAAFIATVKKSFS